MLNDFSVPEFPRLSLFADRGRFLALAGPEIIQLRATGAAFLFHFDSSDARGMNREDALDAFAVGNSANGKSLVQSAPFSSNHDASKNLDPFLVALHHPGVHANAVADLELRGVGLELFFLNSVDDPVHNTSSKGVAGGAELLSESARNATSHRARAPARNRNRKRRPGKIDHEQEHEHDSEELPAAPVELSPSTTIVRPHCARSST